MEEKKDFYKNILDNLYDGVYFCNKERRITYWNKAAEKLTGYTAGEMMGSLCWDNFLTHTNMQGQKLCETAGCPAVRVMREGFMIEEEIYIKHKKGYRIPVITRISPVRNESGGITGAIEIFSDNSAKIAAFQKIEKLEELAFIDSLTGVGNRRYTEIKVSAKLEEMERLAWAGKFGILFTDIDRFKITNDTYGHDAGDEVLKVVSRTILNNLREEDFIGRWGGEEFVVIISNIDRKKLYFIAEKLRVLVENSGVTAGRDTVKVTISTGGVLAERGNTVEELIKRADGLMYECKRNGRNCVKIG